VAQPVIETLGARMPALGFGTWALSGRACREAVADAIDIGYRHIDTARMYRNEREVGQGLRDSGVARDDVFVVTKLYDDDLRPDAVGRAVADSLHRLDLDRVDLLLVHWPNPSVPVTETLAAMLAERDAGRVRHLGVSNFGPRELEEALAAAPVLTNQVPYSPYDDNRRLLDVARSHGVVTTAYTPIAKGRVAREPTIVRIADRLGKTPVQVTLRWLVQQPLVAAIPKAGEAGHRRANFDIFDFELEADDMAAMDAIATGAGRRRAGRG
jgi:diketogulonate reductase-like aldo/keto reductase